MSCDQLIWRFMLTRPSNLDSLLQSLARLRNQVAKQVFQPLTIHMNRYSNAFDTNSLLPRRITCVLCRHLQSLYQLLRSFSRRMPHVNLTSSSEVGDHLFTLVTRDVAGALKPNATQRWVNIPLLENTSNKTSMCIGDSDYLFIYTTNIDLVLSSDWPWSSQRKLSFDTLSGVRTIASEFAFHQCLYRSHRASYV
jgi:hypothetical protein